ncbi:MAG TPA: hypothetical protein VNM43_06280 [Dehalococcoidia bacterium]|nr:hypothetical protein [Dehalococcoidia bacterium]
MGTRDVTVQRLLGQPVSRRTVLAAASAGLLAPLLASCRSERAATASPGISPAPTPTASPSLPPLRVSALAQDLTVGPNRFVFVLLNPDGSLVRDVITRADFRRGDAVTQTLAPTIRSLPHVAFDGAPKGEIIFFVTEPEFDAPGDWAVDVTATSAQETRSARYHFTVTEKSRTPRLGMPAVLSRNAAVGDGVDATRLCSRVPPCPFHVSSVAAALAAGRPVVLNFGSPAHDGSSVSSSVLDLLVKLQPGYADRFEFIHIEVWKDFEGRVFAPAVLEWGLLTEPWTFVIARNARVAGRFESVFDGEELSAVLDWLIREGA